MGHSITMLNYQRVSRILHICYEILVLLSLWRKVNHQWWESPPSKLLFYQEKHRLNSSQKKHRKRGCSGQSKPLSQNFNLPRQCPRHHWLRQCKPDLKRWEFQGFCTCLHLHRHVYAFVTGQPLPRKERCWNIITYMTDTSTCQANTRRDMIIWHNRLRQC